jgi:hypothetical protein
VLHFRASGREQAWPLRVRQNAAWLARLEDPERLIELRILLRRAGAEREAGPRATRHGPRATQRGAGAARRRPGATQRGAGATRRRPGATHRGAGATRRGTATRAGRGTARARGGATTRRPARSGPCAAEAEAARLAATLTRIYHGGWWRLRRWVLPLMRLVRRRLSGGGLRSRFVHDAAPGMLCLADRGSWERFQTARASPIFRTTKWLGLPAFARARVV